MRRIITYLIFRFVKYRRFFVSTRFKVAIYLRNKLFELFQIEVRETLKQQLVVKMIEIFIMLVFYFGLLCGFYMLLNWYLHGQLLLAIYVHTRLYIIKLLIHFFIYLEFYVGFFLGLIVSYIFKRKK